MKSYKCDMCNKYIDGDVPYELTILARFVDPRDRETTEDFDICDECYKKIKHKLRKRKKWGK